MEVGLDSFQRQVAERFAFFSGNDCEDSDDVEKEISRQASKTKSVKEVQMDNISGLPNELLVRVLSLVPTFTVCTYGFYRQEPAIT
ncbi:BnaCnng73430D [Brassica napus]|uniref:BnaCnng73430D protein n=1 Tax=Brassica napus TaxID=3708 RepID=A0A078JXY2_BRANA|nr:BnaCnng73430D [Brassica napus]